MIEPDRMNELLRMCAACPKMCRHVCPTFLAWRSDAPTPHGRALLMHQETVGAHAMDTRGIEVLYQCLECSHCLTWCRPEVDIATFVEIRRRDLVRSGKQPTGILKLANLVKKTHNPYGEDQANRNDWIATARTNGTKIFYFTGCTAAYREKSIAQDTVTLLEQIGYSVEISPDEWCCGSPLFRTGNIDLGLEMAKHNVMSLNQSDADSILVTCPGCYRVLTSDYPLNGFKLNKPVVHISEFLSKSKANLPRVELDGVITYHDPCHLGRHSGIYDAPRRIIREVTGFSVVEMERNRENAMCCGNGAGLRTLFPQHAKRIGAERIQHAKNIGAQYLVTACPFCKNMLASQSNNEITVLDLPELAMMKNKGQYDKTD